MGYGDFGPISVSVGQTTVPLTYSGAGYGTVYFPDSVTLGTGGMMRFRGGGSGGIPNFDVTATIPGLGVLTAPAAAADGGAVAIDTSKDLSLAWSPISIGVVAFELYDSSLSVGSTSNSIVCTFDGAAGTGVVPQALLAAMKSLSTSQTYADLGATLQATTEVDGLSIIINSSQSAAPPTRDLDVQLE